MKSNKKGEDMKNILLAIVFIGSLVSLNALHAQGRLAEQSEKKLHQGDKCKKDTQCPEGQVCHGRAGAKSCVPWVLQR